MARHRRGSNLKMIGIIAVVAIGIGLGFFIISGDFLEEVNIGSFYGEDANFSLLSLYPNLSVNCGFTASSVEKFTDGTQYVFGTKTQ